MSYQPPGAPPGSSDPRRRFIVCIAVLLIVLTLCTAFIRYRRPIPSAPARPVYAYAGAETAPSLSWPSYGQAAIGETKSGVLAVNGPQVPRPTASMAKVFTALAVLKAKPLNAGDKGPTITLTAADVAIYNSYITKNGSVAAVAAGEQISEYDALTAMMLPSANNMADTLAVWAFGSMDAYVSFANALVKEMGLTQTTIADASGMSPQTVSTSEDMVKAGLDALKQPVLKEIVSKTTAAVPVAGTILNTNKLLGQAGINGIKTGMTVEAGDCLLFSSSFTAADGTALQLAGVIMGAPSRPAVFDDTVKLLDSAQKNFVVASAVKSGVVVGRYALPWGGVVEAVASQDMNILRWNGQKLSPKLELQGINAGVSSGSNVGRISIDSKVAQSDIPVTLKQNATKPSAWWRIKR